MRYGIFSDVHSNTEALEAVIAAYKKESIDIYLCVGDIVGYASEPNKCAEAVKALVCFTVSGNHDWASVGLLSLAYFNYYAKKAISWTKDKLKEEAFSFLASLKLLYRNADLTMVHGTLSNPGEFDYMADSEIARETFGLMETNVCFVGHTHVPGAFVRKNNRQITYLKETRFKIAQDNKYIIDVGSVGQPRDGDPRSVYCIYDTDKEEICLKRVAYDTRVARNKIIAAGLPSFLGNRLLVGN